MLIGMRRLGGIALLALALTITGCGSVTSTPGAAPTASETAAGVTVPDVTGMPGDEARDTLTGAGFVVDWGGEVVLKPSNWIVEAQTPAAGDASAAGATVTLTVSKPAGATSDDSAGPDRGPVVDQAIRDAFGGQTYAELLAADPTSWAGWITGVRVENGNAYVTLQVGANDAERKPLGEQAAQALSTLLPASAVEGVSWIIVEDASGVVIDQKQPSPIS